MAHEITPVIDSAPKSFAVYGDGCVTGSEEDAKEHSKGDEEANEKEASIRENESKTGKVKGETCWSRSTGTQPPSILLGQYKFDYPNHLSQTFEIEKKNVPTLR